MNAFLTAFGLFLIIGGLGMFIVNLQARSRLVSLGGLVALGFGVIFILLGLTVVSVGPNERMVVFNRVTGNLANPRGPGLTIVNPITTSYEIYDVSRQTYTMSAQFTEGNIQGDDAVSARTAGGQEVFIDATVIYRINPDRVNEVHVNWPDKRYQDELIRPLLRSVIRDAVSLFDVESIYQERTTIDAQITEAVQPALEKEGFVVEDILVRNVNFTPEYASAIEAAQIAEVNIREQEFRVREEEQRAEQVQMRARGEAEARKIQAEAEAAALQYVANVLAANPELLEYQYVQNLSDNIEILALPASAPYLFDLQAVLDRAAENAPAPTEAPSEGN